MSEWSDVALGDVAELTVGFVGTMARHYEESGVPFLRSQNVKQHRIDMQDVKFISSDFNGLISKSQLNAGDVVTVRTGTPGVSAVVPSSLNGANCSDLVITRPGPGLWARWLSYYLNSAAAPVISASLVGAVQQHFNVGAAKRLRLWLPPLAEQQAIAEVLGALDDKIAANIALAKGSAELAATAFRSAALDGAEEVRLESISELVVRGGAPRYVEEGAGVLVLNQKCIRDEVVTLAPARWTDSMKVRSDRLLRFEDVLVNSTGQGTLGRVARWTSAVEATVDSHITIVRPNPLMTDAAVAGYAILAAQAEIEALGEGSTGQTELNRHELGRLRIRVPERERARALGSVLRALTALGDAARAENRTLAETRDALLPQLMSGKLRVRDVERLASEAAV